jgi:YbgC/YbaW family acyl-CoA thioester hydrolase
MPRLSEHTLHRRVLFHEVDSAGIVHFSVYFRYMEEAEHAMWREAGLSIAPPGGTVGFPRVSAAFEYLRPLHFEDEFDVHIRIVAIREKSMRYECTMTRGGEKVGAGAITVVCVARRPGEPMKAMPLPPHIAERFEVSVERVES